MAAQTFTAFTPEIWSPRLNFYFQAKLVAGKFFDNYSDDVAEGGDIVHIPNITQGFSAADVKVTSGDVTSADLSDTNTNLNIDKWKAVAYHISDFQYRQVASKYKIRDAYARTMANNLAQTFDTALFAQGANITASVGSSATDLLATSVEKAFSILESNSIPKEECALFLNPKTYWTKLMKIAKYYDASQFGKPSVPQGAHDLLYGVPVVITPQIPVGTAGTEGDDIYRNLLVHPSSLIYAMGRKGVQIKEKQSESLRVKLIADIMYGVGYLNANAGVRILG